MDPYEVPTTTAALLSDRRSLRDEPDAGARLISRRDARVANHVHGTHS